MFILICVVGYIAALTCSVVWFEKRNIVESGILGTVLWIISHIFSSMGLFVIDKYTVFRAAFGSMVLDLILLAVTVIIRRDKPFSIKGLFKCDLSLKEVLIPILVCAVAVPFAAKNNEFFGMGQDEGVYQTQAVGYINGNTKRQKDFDEYHLLETDDERTAFEFNVRNHLYGWDISSANYPDTVYDFNVSPVSGIYHGIPNYSALLAAWGTLFGMEHMADINIIFFVCTVFMVYFVCRNLKLKKLSSLCACTAAALAPVVIWVAKGSLTEMFLTVLPLTFLYFMTDSERPQHRWLSIVPVAAFACYHVSIFTMVPMFFIIYAAMYLFTRQKQFAVLMPVLLVGYLASFFMMRHVQPFYTMNNYRDVCVGVIDAYTLPLAVSIAVAAGVIASAVYIFIVQRKTADDFSEEDMLSKAADSILFRIFLIALIVLPILFIIAKGIMKYENWTGFSHITLLGFAANGGLLLVVLGIIFTVIFAKDIAQSTSRLIVFVMFFYCILVYSAVLRYEIEYYFYYSRYLAPFIPIAVIFSVMALDRFGGKLICPVTAAGLIYTMPFDTYLLTHRDDTRMEWSIMDDITDFIDEGDSVVVGGFYRDLLWLPLDDMTDVSIYPEYPRYTEYYDHDGYSDGGTLDQFYRLSRRSDRVLLVTDEIQDPESFDLVYTNRVKCSEDTGESVNKFIPMPESFTETEKNIYVYKFNRYQLEYTAADDYTKLYGVSALEETFCWTNSEITELACGLYPTDYELTIDLAFEMPLGAYQDNNNQVTVYLNGRELGARTISGENNGQALHFYVNEEDVIDGRNILTIRSELWDVSLIGNDESRTLGIPLESVHFAPV